MIRTCSFTLLVLLTAAPIARGQATQEIESAPAPVNDWRATGVPLLFGGIAYYPTGPQVFFNPSVMVRVGSFEGVPLYQDATLEANSVIFVPVSGKLMRPYERRRTGELAGTVGSRTPSFPIDLSSENPPTAELESESEPAAFESLTPFPKTAARSALEPPLTDIPHVARCSQAELEKTRVPVAGGIWIEFDQNTWTLMPAGAPSTTTGLMVIGRLHGFPVYRDAAKPDEIYVPARPEGPLTRYVLTASTTAAARTSGRLPVICSPSEK